VDSRLRRRDRTFLICGGATNFAAVGEDLPRAFVDRDRALEWIEQRLLEEAGKTMPEERLGPRHFGAAMGLGDDENAALMDHLEMRELRAGETLFREGEPSDELYFVLWGRVSIVHGEVRPDALRVVTFLPGNILGNVAFADALPRTASAVCEEDCGLVLLRRSSLQALAAERPELVTRIYVELAADIAARLRATDELLRESA
jgi:SulP family sulfate permease